MAVRESCVTTTSWTKAPGARAKNGPHTTARAPAVPARKGNSRRRAGEASSAAATTTKGRTAKALHEQARPKKAPPTTSAPVRPLSLSPSKTAASPSTHKVAQKGSSITVRWSIRHTGYTAMAPHATATVSTPRWRNIQPSANTPTVSTSGTTTRAAAKAVAVPTERDHRANGSMATGTPGGWSSTKLRYGKIP